jgi:hypothetical protein
MNSCDVQQSGSKLEMPELSEHVLEVTLAAVRERRRQRKTRNWRTVVIAVLAVAMGIFWLTRDTVSPEHPPTIAPTMGGASKSAELRIVKFSTVQTRSLSTRVVRTSDLSPQVVLIDDERFLELCDSVGGGLITLADKQRVALVASMAFDDDDRSMVQP